MELKYLKMEAPEAVEILEQCLTEGYQVKDSLENDYFNVQNQVATGEKITEWRKKMVDWTDSTLKKLASTFLYMRQQYNFRDAAVSPLSRIGINTDYDGIVKVLQARLNVLDSQINFIFQHSPIQIIAGRDANVQIGGISNKQEVKNEG